MRKGRLWIGLAGMVVILGLSACVQPAPVDYGLEIMPTTANAIRAYDAISRQARHLTPIANRGVLYVFAEGDDMTLTIWIDGVKSGQLSDLDSSFTAFALPVGTHVMWITADSPFLRAGKLARSKPIRVRAIAGENRFLRVAVDRDGWKTTDPIHGELAFRLSAMSRAEAVQQADQRRFAPEPFNPPQRRNYLNSPFQYRMQGLALLHD